ncbi:MAG: hypothetical protein ACPL07_04125 [Candidatus Bathyarchaeia archaeon]
MNHEGKIGYKPTERERLNTFTYLGFDEELAEALAQFDAIIFLHTSNLKGGHKAWETFPRPYSGNP